MYYYKTEYRLLTCYHFVDIPSDEVDNLVREHLQFCKDIDMRGRVYIGTEGISSTVTGNIGQLQAYRLYLSSIPYFKDIEDIDVKSTAENGHCFEKMFVKQRNEIVALGKKYSACEIQEGGNRMDTEELKRVIDENDTDYVILDMRNDYEYKLGHFKNAVPANTINFRELDDVLANYKRKYPGKKIVTYCTGGIRCEKATVMMREAGLEDVYQLDGGVMKYINKHNDGNWLGSLYVFDDRISLEVGDETTHTTIGTCVYSDKLTDNCENCRHADCNARIIAHPEEYKQHMGFCSEDCATKGTVDLLVKDISWDDFSCPGNTEPTGEYKMLRSFVRHNKLTTPEAQTLIKKHLDKKLQGIEFRHKESQKEEVIYQD